MDESQKHYARQKKPDVESTSIVWFHLYEISKKGRSMEMENTLPPAGAGGKIKD